MNLYIRKLLAVLLSLIYRKNFPRKVLKTEELSDEDIKQIKNTKMDSRHNHLNNLYDDTH
jgi:hypothetical protein